MAEAADIVTKMAFKVGTVRDILIGSPRSYMTCEQLPVLTT